jgi:hypothetical protein
MLLTNSMNRSFPKLKKDNCNKQATNKRNQNVYSILNINIDSKTRREQVRNQRATVLIPLTRAATEKMHSDVTILLIRYEFEII